MPIGEFSKRSGLSLKRLRTYAAEGLIVPAAVDPVSGYRYYAPGQVRQAEVVEALRQATIPLADIRKILRRQSEHNLDAWARQLDVDAEVRRGALDRARSLLATADPPLPESDRRDVQGVAMSRLKAAGRSETGPVRHNNEDVVVSSDRLAVVADGMGGLPGGELAADTAASLLRATFTGKSLHELEAGARAANWAIWNLASGRPEFTGMGTTICAAGLLDDGRLAVVHVGDSRAYLWHDTELFQLTRDHTVTVELIERGELTEDEAPRHPHFGILTRALGVAPDVTIEGASHSIEAGDRLLVCSDGLVNELNDAAIALAVASDRDIAAIADDLVRTAITRGGRDNVSVVVAEVAA